MENKHKKNLIKKARKEWVTLMRSIYPDFTEKKWAKTSYRIAHPQIFNLTE